MSRGGAVIVGIGEIGFGGGMLVDGVKEIGEWPSSRVEYHKEYITRMALINILTTRLLGPVLGYGSMKVWDTKEQKDLESDWTDKFSVDWYNTLKEHINESDNIFKKHLDNLLINSTCFSDANISIMDCITIANKENYHQQTKKILGGLIEAIEKFEKSKRKEGEDANKGALDAYLEKHGDTLGSATGYAWKFIKTLLTLYTNKVVDSVSGWGRLAVLIPALALMAGGIVVGVSTDADDFGCDLDGANILVGGAISAAGTMYFKMFAKDINVDAKADVNKYRQTNRVLYQLITEFENTPLLIEQALRDLNYDPDIIMSETSKQPSGAFKLLNEMYQYYLAQSDVKHLTAAISASVGKNKVETSTSADNLPARLADANKRTDSSTQALLAYFVFRQTTTDDEKKSIVRAVADRLGTIINPGLNLERIKEVFTKLANIENITDSTVVDTLKKLDGSHATSLSSTGNITLLNQHSVATARAAVLQILTPPTGEKTRCEKLVAPVTDLFSNLGSWYSLWHNRNNKAGEIAANVKQAIDVTNPNNPVRDTLKL